MRLGLHAISERIGVFDLAIQVMKHGEARTNARTQQREAPALSR